MRRFCSTKPPEASIFSLILQEPLHDGPRGEGAKEALSLHLKEAKYPLGRTLRSFTLGVKPKITLQISKNPLEKASGASSQGQLAGLFDPFEATLGHLGLFGLWISIHDP